MKCPKCGFVSYPGISQCKKCGYSFAPGKPAGGTPQVLGLFSAAASAPAAEARASQPPEQHPALAPPETLPARPAIPSAPRTTIPTARAIPDAAPRPVIPLRPLQAELSQRVEDFRRRRARLRGRDSMPDNLEFDFQSERQATAETDSETRLDESSREDGLDVLLEKPQGALTADSAMDSLSLHHRAGPGMADATPFDAVGYELETEPVPAHPVEIVLDSHPPAEEAVAPAHVSRLPLAPLRRRFLGGLVDALVLVVSAALFALIFWRAGGHVSIQPLNVVVFALIVVAFIMGYFGAFTALTATTPGLLWMGIEVRSQSGALPTSQQAFWRAFGYLVSISAVMLGFVWALVDSDGLTWHDRMSDTFLTDAENAVENRHSTVKG